MFSSLDSPLYSSIVLQIHTCRVIHNSTIYNPSYHRSTNVQSGDAYESDDEDEPSTMYFDRISIFDRYTYSSIVDRSSDMRSLFVHDSATRMHYCGGDECDSDDEGPNTMYS